MINLADIGGLYKATPDNVKDPRTQAFMYACDRQIKKLLGYAEKTKVWCDIGAVDKKHLDYMAAESRALLYDPSSSDEVKRDLITNAQYWNTRLGTFDVLKEVINSAFPGRDSVIREWFEYGGKPYFFKIITDADMDEESIEEFNRMISTVKNARSRLEGFEIERNLRQKLHHYGICLSEKDIRVGWEG